MPRCWSSEATHLSYRPRRYRLTYLRQSSCMRTRVLLVEGLQYSYYEDSSTLVGVLTPLRGTRFSIIKSYPTVHPCNSAPSCQDEALHIVLLFLCHHPPVGTQHAASAYMALGGGFGRCTQRPFYLTQISVWSGFKFQAVFLSPLTLNLSSLNVIRKFIKPKQSTLLFSVCYASALSCRV